jgi:hypothetical protein
MARIAKKPLAFPAFCANFTRQRQKWTVAVT